MEIEENKDEKIWSKMKSPTMVWKQPIKKNTMWRLLQKIMIKEPYVSASQNESNVNENQIEDQFDSSSIHCTSPRDKENVANKIAITNSTTPSTITNSSAIIICFKGQYI